MSSSTRSPQKASAQNVRESFIQAKLDAITTFHTPYSSSYYDEVLHAITFIEEEMFIMR